MIYCSTLRLVHLIISRISQFERQDGCGAASIQFKKRFVPNISFTFLGIHSVIGLPLIHALHNFVFTYPGVDYNVSKNILQLSVSEFLGMLRPKSTQEMPMLRRRLHVM